MAADPTNYALRDLIPFTAEVYLRLVERQNAAFWPLHLVLLPLGAAALVLAWRGHGRTLAALLAPAWAGVAVTFHLRLFAELTFTADYIAGAFIAQGVLMLICGLRGGLTPGKRRNPLISQVLGWAVAGTGLIVFPLLGPASGRGWAGAECFPLAPDPTVLVTLGLLVVAARPLWLLLLLPIPVLWCAVSTAIGATLELPLAWLPSVAATLALAGAIWKAVKA